MIYIFFFIVVTCKWIWVELTLRLAELVQRILNTEVNLGSRIAKLTTEAKDLLAHSKKLEANVAIARNVNCEFIEEAVAAERQYWEDAQYLRSDTLELMGIPTSVEEVCDVFQKIGVDIRVPNFALTIGGYGTNVNS